MRSRVSPSAAVQPSAADRRIGAVISSYAALGAIRKKLPKLLPEDRAALLGELQEHATPCPMVGCRGHSWSSVHDMGERPDFQLPEDDPEPATSAEHLQAMVHDAEAQGLYDRPEEPATGRTVGRWPEGD